LVGPLAHLQVLDVDAGLEPDHGAEADAEPGIEVRLLDDLELDVRLDGVVAEAGAPGERGDRHDGGACRTRGRDHRLALRAGAAERLCSPLAASPSRGPGAWLHTGATPRAHRPFHPNPIAKESA